MLIAFGEVHRGQSQFCAHVGGEHGQFGVGFDQFNLASETKKMCQKPHHAT